MQCSLQRHSTSVYLVVGTTRFNKQIMPTEPARFIDGRLSLITDNLKSRINNNYCHVKCLQTYGKGSCKLWDLPAWRAQKLKVNHQIPSLLSECISIHSNSKKERNKVWCTNNNHESDSYVSRTATCSMIYWASGYLHPVHNAVL